MDRPRALRLPPYVSVLGLLAALLVVLPSGGGAPRRLTDADCGGDGWVLALPGQPAACAHSDAPPRGVDVHRPVTTQDLRVRKGAGPRAYAAAQSLGVPGSYASTATSSAVTCDGDGTSGARVQAMYVVEAGRTNRYLDVLPSLQLWAAGVDDVLNRSAALTGGARSVRYVTDTVGGSCVARVLNVTVPAGATASFSSTVSAVQALGYTNPARKYLMWTDANALCGIATMYPDETAGQSNLNNGRYPEYARVDAGCWGLGNGSDQHSVEAHELTHTLGAVQYQAPHSTRAGHCWDEADTMCYADGGTHAMVSVCPAQQEYLLDCNSDDYWSTFPPAGSYLATAWDAANSQFLIGGGNGTSGGTLGAPTSLGGSLAVNNPAVPGLPTQASVTPELPTGRTLTGVTWRAGRSDCTVVAQGDGTQATVTCPANAVTATSLTATLTDSTGATKAVTSPLTFQTTGAPRAVRLALTVDGGAPSVGVCTWVPASARLTAVDVASGVPVKGLTALFTRQAAGATPSLAAYKITGNDGTATAALVTGTTTTYAATSPATGPYQPGVASGVLVTPARCTADLSGSASTSTPWYGDTVTVTGALRRTVSSPDDTPVGGAGVQVTVKAPDTVSATGATVVGRTTLLATATTDASGAFTATFRAALAGRLSVTLPATTGLAAATADLGGLSLRLPSTTLTASAGTSSVAYGAVVPVNGTLLRVTDAAAPLTGALVAVQVTAPGRAPVTAAYGQVRSDGTWTAQVYARTNGTLTAVYAGSTGQPGASAAAGTVTVGSWTPTLTLAAASATSVSPGGSVDVRGTVTRTYGGTTEPARSVLVTFVLTPTNGSAPQLLTYSTTTLTGAFLVRTYPRTSGTITALVSKVAGYADAASTGVPVTVT